MTASLCIPYRVRIPGRWIEYLVARSLEGPSQVMSDEASF